MADDPTRGLYGKYQVERTDGKPMGRCIVLELDDPNAWDALETWAGTVGRAGYRSLALDVQFFLREARSRHEATG